MEERHIKHYLHGVVVAGGCLEWKGEVRGGKPYMDVWGKPFEVRRMVYAIYQGIKPRGDREVECRIGNKLCVTPSHLVEVGERLVRGARGYRGATHCVHGHEFTEANTYRRPGGGRQCKMCLRANARKYWRKLRRQKDEEIEV